MPKKATSVGTPTRDATKATARLIAKTPPRIKMIKDSFTCIVYQNQISFSDTLIYMSELKTLPNDASVEAFIDQVPDETRRNDSITLLNMFEKITGEKAKMWGTAIIGFGKYHYKSERSSQEGDWPLVGFSPRKQNLTLYVMSELTTFDDLLEKLGKHKTSKACLYINKLADVDPAVLEKIIDKAYKDAKKNLT